jgi:hypothetical protein
MKNMPVRTWVGIMSAMAAEWGCTWEEAGEAMLSFFEARR